MNVFKGRSQAKRVRDWRSRHVVNSAEWLGRVGGSVAPKDGRGNSGRDGAGVDRGSKPQTILEVCRGALYPFGEPSGKEAAKAASARAARAAAAAVSSLEDVTLKLNTHFGRCFQPASVTLNPRAPLGRPVDWYGFPTFALKWCQGVMCKVISVISPLHLSPPSLDTPHAIERTDFSPSFACRAAREGGCLCAPGTAVDECSDRSDLGGLAEVGWSAVGWRWSSDSGGVSCNLAFGTAPGGPSGFEKWALPVRIRAEVQEVLWPLRGCHG